MSENLFITGISGCVGHYLFDVLSKDPNYQLYLLVRYPEKIKFDYQSLPNVSLINADLRETANYADLLKKMDYVIHLAAEWGGVELNYEYTLSFFNLLDPERCKKIIYFSTTSILKNDGKLWEEAGTYGPPYIKGKYLCYKDLPKLKIYNRIITLFPTLIFGGDNRHPFSHASAALVKNIKRLNLIRFVHFDLRFHFIHACDISLIVKHLLENEIKESRFILGGKSITLDQFVNEIWQYLGKKVYPKINLSPAFIKGVAQLLGRKLSAWDLLCLERRSWEYETTDLSTFGLKSNYQTAGDLLRDAQI